MTQAELTYGTIMKITIVECGIAQAVYLWHSYKGSTNVDCAMTQEMAQF